VAPSGLNAHAQSDTQIWVGWSDNSSNETGFRLSDSLTTVALAANSNSYVWTVSPGTYKCFEVQSYNSAGSSAWISWACTTTPAPTPTPTQCYLASSTNVTVYSGTNYSGSSVNLNFGQGNVNNLTNLPWTPKSFTDPNSASHIVMFAGQNGTGNLTHYETAQADISNISSQSSTGWSVRAYVKGC
jgi:titin